MNLSDVVGPSRKTIRWTMQQFRRAKGPIVYIFWQDRSAELAVYVGRSFNGLTRPLDRGHHKADALKGATEIEFVCCESDQDAIHLERKLIRLLKPSHNIGMTRYNDSDLKRSKATPELTIELQAAAMRHSFFTK